MVCRWFAISARYDSNFLRGLPMQKDTGSRGQLVNINLAKEGRELCEPDPSHVSLDKDTKLRPHIVARGFLDFGRLLPLACRLRGSRELPERRGRLRTRASAMCSSRPKTTSARLPTTRTGAGSWWGAAGRGAGATSSSTAAGVSAATGS